MEQNQNSSRAISLVVIALITVFAIGVYSFKLRGSAPEENTVTPTTSAVSPTHSTEIAATAFKDGEYAVDGEYATPGGNEVMGVQLTLKNGVIENASVENKAKLPASVKFQGIFADNFKKMVVGKKISEVKLDKVAGSSLSPKGFNDAVEKIKEKAKA